MTSKRKIEELSVGDASKRQRVEPPSLTSDENIEPSQEDLPSEWDRFFDSQYYKNDTTMDRKKEVQPSFPGPAGVIKTPKSEKKHSEAKQLSTNQKFIRQNLFKDVTSAETICPLTDNASWIALKESFDLSYRDKENIINKINIKIILEKLKRWNQMEGRCHIPFLAATIDNDGGIGSAPDPNEKGSSLVINLRDKSGSMSALLEKDVVLQLSHIIRQGASLILQRPQFHKINGEPQLSITKDAIVCVFLNMKYIEFELWRDIPPGFWSKEVNKDVICLQQKLIQLEEIRTRIAEFEISAKAARKSLKTLSPHNSSACSDAKANFKISIAQKDDAFVFDDDDEDVSFLEAINELENKSLKDDTMTSKPVMINSETADSKEKEEIFVDFTASKNEKLLEPIKNEPSCSYSILVQTEKCPMADNNDAGDFSDDDDLELSLLKTLENIEKEAMHRKEIEQTLKNPESEAIKTEKVNNSDNNDGDDFSDDDELELSVLKTLENMEKEAMQCKEMDQNSIINEENELIGEFDDDDDGESDALILSVLEKSNF